MIDLHTIDFTATHQNHVKADLSSWLFTKGCPPIVLFLFDVGMPAQESGKQNCLET
jgi:hypothetical protein